MSEDADKGRTGEQKMGMLINIQTTECKFLEEGNKKFHLEVEGQELEQTENCVYLGGNIRIIISIGIYVYHWCICTLCRPLLYISSKASKTGNYTEERNDSIKG